MPLDEGYLHESAMVEHAFSDVMTWQPRIRTIFHKHHNLTTAIQSHLTHHPWTTPIHPLTSRVNPTFSIHDHLVIKWFSPLNRLWGECHEAHVLTVDFPKSGREQNVMPARLLCQLDSYLPLHASSLVTSDTPVVLLHQDLTDENILGYVAASSPSSMSPLMTALACLPPLDRAALEGYCQAHGITTVADLVAVEPWADCTGASDASRWHGDVALCRELLHTPYWATYVAASQATTTATRLCRRLMQLTLLHPSQSVAALFHHFPHAKTLATWDDIAQFVFGPMVADLEEAQRARKCTRGDVLSTAMAALSVVTVP
ncbi:hypothetical protein DYB37_010009 [Aphanomyces astaci]|uniref:Uncharacterized protein n=1 Tax=Aphanomyces astaci TaxID=112090 RepID=A0A3R7EGM0_APHAT|nr:hypothetical protein DYB35_011508 [Aphanomyces astaci]RHZ25743.1 hypothetical protein DYB37_010009 [Aphanomyces astaci]